MFVWAWGEGGKRFKKTKKKGKEKICCVQELLHTKGVPLEGVVQGHRWLSHFTSAVV